MSKTTLSQLEQLQDLLRRLNDPGASETSRMPYTVGATSLDDLIQQTVPASIRLPQPLAIGASQTEADALASLKNIAAKNVVNRSFIGMGYYDTHTPNVILRNVLENPGWYTAYTPYQPEI